MRRRAPACGLRRHPAPRAAMSRPQPESNILEDFENLSRAELRALWTAELAEEPPPTLGRDVLALGIAYVRQERRYGGLAKPAAKGLDRLLARALGNGDDPPKLPAGPLPRAGTILVREWRGITHHVT